MSRAVSPSVDRVYGWCVSPAAGTFRPAAGTFRGRPCIATGRHRPVLKRRPGPVGPCDDATLLLHTGLDFHDCWRLPGSFGLFVVRTR
jgi:hypothetical protein